MLGTHHKKVHVFVLDPANVLVSLEKDLEIRGYKVVRKTTPDNLNNFINTNCIKRFVVISSPALSNEAKNNLERLSEARWSKKHSIKFLKKREIKYPKSLVPELNNLLKQHTPPFVYRCFSEKPWRAFIASIIASILGSAAYAYVSDVIELRASMPIEYKLTPENQVAPNPNNVKDVPVIE